MTARSLSLRALPVSLTYFAALSKPTSSESGGVLEYMNLNTEGEPTVPGRHTESRQKGTKARNFFDRNRVLLRAPGNNLLDHSLPNTHPSRCHTLAHDPSSTRPVQWQYQLAIMVKEEEIITEAAGGRGYMDMVGLGDEDLFRCLSPSSYYLSSSVVSTAAAGVTPAAASSPTCVSYMDVAPPPYHHMLSFTGQEQYDYHGNGIFGLHYNTCDRTIPGVVPQKSSPTT
jgi:hypothetical protein